MKQKWSAKWNASTQPRKQRKYRIHAPMSVKRKFLGCHLSESLREKYDKRTVVLRKGDTVLISRGDFADKKGKVDLVDTKKGRVTVEGIKRKKVDGTEVSVPLQPSNLIIVELNLEDKSRFKEAGKVKESKVVKKELPDTKEKIKPEKLKNKV